MYAHLVVNAPACKDHLRVIAHLLGPVGEVIGIDPDAVPADKAGAERQKVPLGACRLKDFQGIQAKSRKDQRKFIDQRDVQIALRVLDHLGRFCRRDR